MKSIDHDYSTVISGPGVAVVNMERAARQVVKSETAFYKLVSSSDQADLSVARAKAEERRAAAVATEQEMRARVHEMRAKVVEAEAEVPLAMAEALRGGKIGVLDYYNMKNVQADTAMREAISQGGRAANDKTEVLGS